MWLVAVVLGFSFLVSLIPALFFQSSSQRFEIAKTVFEYWNYFVFLFAAALGLISVSSHLRDRSIKMVATKPVPREIWLASHFMAASIVVVALLAGNLLLTSLLFLAWKIPLQSGLLLLAATTACRCIVLFSFLTFLSVVMHPAMAAVVALVLQDATFYQLGILTASAERMTDLSWYKALLASIKYLLLIAYKLLPVYSPYAEEFAYVASSLRAEASHLAPFLWTGVYTATFAGLLFLLTASVLGRRRLI